MDQGDLHRVAAATGAQIQTTVNKLDAKVLGSCADFEEKQVNRSGPPRPHSLCIFSGAPNTHAWPSVVATRRQDSAAEPFLSQE